MSYGHAPAIEKQNWRCPKCGLVDPSTVHKVPSPVDDIHYHVVLGLYRRPTAIRHIVCRDRRAA